MDVLAVSPASEFEDELDLLVSMLDVGLARYHLRKPSWSCAACADWIESLPRQFHRRVSIHQCYALANEYDVCVHQKDHAEEIDNAKSKSLHELDALSSPLTEYEYAFLSPVFPSMSKPDYIPSWSEETLRNALLQPRSAKLYALGGVSASNAQVAIQYGFDGVVLHGALWLSNDPLRVLDNVMKEVA